MELPRPLREAVDRHLEGLSLRDLEAAALHLSVRYRAETRDGRRHIESALEAKAYLATRLPATYAAIRTAMDAVAARRPDFAPGGLLDVGAGPATALWAALDRWPLISDVDLIEASGPIRDLGGSMASSLAASIQWHASDIAVAFPDVTPRDLVVLAYVLDELEPAQRLPLLDRLWSRTRDVLLIVEPGTPAGWQRILAARAHLIAAGGHVLAPCPHEFACPLVPPDWCHFARRVARSRIHRQAKQADVPWEDEKFIYVAVSRTPGLPATARVIAPPLHAKGRVTLKLCQEDGTAAQRLFSKRDGAAYKEARRADWGDDLNCLKPPPAD